MYLPSDAETNGSLKTFDNDKLGPKDDAFDHEVDRWRLKAKYLPSNLKRLIQIEFDFYIMLRLFVIL